MLTITLVWRLFDYIHSSHNQTCLSIIVNYKENLKAKKFLMSAVDWITALATLSDT